MRVALSLAGTDAGRSGLGVYLSSILPSLALELVQQGHELLIAGSPGDLAAYDPILRGCVALRGVETAALPSWIDRPGPGALWHLGCFGPWAALHGASVVLLPAANRRLSAGPIPTVAVVHDLAAQLVDGKYDRFRAAYARHLVAPALARARRLVAISQATRRDLCDVTHRPEDQVEVVPNGVDCARFHPGVPPHREDQPYLLYTSRLEHPGKNHRRLLEAFARSSLARSHRLLLAGGDWGARALLEASAEALGVSAQVRFLGRVPDEQLPGLTAGATAAIMVGLREGFGLPVLEALACGVPVLVARAGALPEVAGDLGVLCEPHDTADMARGLERAALDPDVRRRVASLGPPYARSFSWESAGQRLARICLGVAA
ncbi:MAG: glycosyltransferase family 4 protein [Polyangiaceae bacterium]|jgi:glycosyltransferase involved in cell wall biosynthesis|nr:glycosyltransferase family 4 protein [Polyangiaceae bacterium]